MRKIFFTLTLLVLIIIIIFIISFFKGPVEKLASNYTPMPQGLGPFAIAITDDGEYAYVGFDLSEVVFKVRLDNLTIESVADLSEYFPIENEHIALDISERKLFVHSTTWQKLIVLDTQNMSVIHTIENITVTGVLRSQYGPFLITWDGGNAVNFINTETYKVTRFTDERIGFLEIQENKQDQDKWYVVTQQGPEGPWLVGIYDYKTKVWSYNVSFPLQGKEGMPDFIVLPNEQKVYLAIHGGWYPTGYHAYGWLYSVDLTKGNVKTIPVDGGALSVEASQDSRWLYVGTGNPIPSENNLLVLDTHSDEIVGQIYLGHNKYGWHFIAMNDLQINPANPNIMYATSTDGNAFIKVNLNNLTLADVVELNEESFQPNFFARRPTQAYGYIPIYQSPTAFELDIDNAAIRRVVTFPSLRTDVGLGDIAISNSGRLFIAQGETILEIDSQDMTLLRTHTLPQDAPTVWRFVLSRDQKMLYSVSQERSVEGYKPNVFLAINTTNFQVEIFLRLEGGNFDERPFELPNSSKLYALGGEDFGPVVIQVINTKNYTLQKTITFNESDSLGVSGGPYYPFAYDSKSHTLFVGATHVVFAIDTDTDAIKKVIYLRDVAKAIGFEGLQPWEFSYVNAVGLVYSPQENYLYIAHLDRSFVSIYDLSSDRFLPKVIPLKGYFPNYMFSNDDFSKIYTLNVRSDSISVIDVKSKTLEKVIDLHAYKAGGLKMKMEFLYRAFKVCPSLIGYRIIA